MQKPVIVFILASLLMLPTYVDGKGPSSSGNSRSSSSFSGGSRSTPSSSRSSTPSFSGGSRSTPSASRPSTPSFSGGSKSTVSKPSAPSFSGGSKSPSSQPTTVSKPTFSGGSQSSTISKPTFSGGSQSSTTTNSASKPTATWNAAATRSAENTQSKANYAKANPPSPKVISYVNKTVATPKTPERASTYEYRSRQVYGSYYNPSTTVVHHYNDGLSNVFWYWMLAQSLDDRATWAYHHRDQIDDSRYREMVAKDAALEAKIKELENKNVQKDATYVPPVLKGNEDTIFDKNVVYEPELEPESEDDFSWGGVIFCVLVIAIVGVGIALWTNKSLN